MKRMLALLLVCSFFLFGCQNAIGVNQDGGIPVTGLYDELLKGSTETKTPFLPVADEYFETATHPETSTVESNTSFQTQSPSKTDDIANEINQTSIAQINNQELSSTVSQLSTNNLITPSIKDTISTSTSTPTGKYIDLIGAYDRRLGVANVVWALHGDFDYGFSVVYSETNPYPVYPDDAHRINRIIRTPITISSLIYATPGHTYYIRVCEHTEEEDGSNDCKFYSNTVVFKFQEAPPTSTPTEHDKIWITSIDYVSNGVAIINWQTIGNYPGGFEVVWENSMPPTNVNEDAIHVSASERSAILMGTPGTSNYYSVCGYTNSTCEDYAVSISYYHQIKPEPTEKTSTPIPPSDTPIPTVADTGTPIVVEATTETPPEEGGE